MAFMAFADGRRLWLVVVDPWHACPHSLSSFLVFPILRRVSGATSNMSVLPRGGNKGESTGGHPSEGIHQRGAPCLTVACLATNLSLLNFSHPAQTESPLEPFQFQRLVLYAGDPFHAAMRDSRRPRPKSLPRQFISVPSGKGRGKGNELVRRHW